MEDKITELLSSCSKIDFGDFGFFGGGKKYSHEYITVIMNRSIKKVLGKIEPWPLKAQNGAGALS